MQSQAKSSGKVPPANRIYFMLTQTTIYVTRTVLLHLRQTQVSRRAIAAMTAENSVTRQGAMLSLLILMSMDNDRTARCAPPNCNAPATVTHGNADG
jgi:hypothetical protein